MERFGAVLAFMERLKIIDSADNWKLINELRNAVNHDDEDDGVRLAEFFKLMGSEAPTLVGYCTRLQTHCVSAYPLF